MKFWFFWDWQMTSLRREHYKGNQRFKSGAPSRNCLTGVLGRRSAVVLSKEKVQVVQWVLGP